MPAKKASKPAKKKTSATTRSKVKDSSSVSAKKTRASAKKKAAKVTRAKMKGKGSPSTPAKKSRASAKKKTSARLKKPTKMPAEKESNSKDRTAKLFTDIEILTAQEPADSKGKPRKTGQQVTIIDASPKLVIPESEKKYRELEILRERIQELEAELKNNGKPGTAPIQYEKNRLGYVFKENSLEPIQRHTLETDSEGEHSLQTPITATGKTIGNMYVEADQERPWEPEEEKLAKIVAQQASLQIQSLRLLASAERARAEAEEATRRFMHEGWQSYMDAIHQHERLGYAYDQDAVVPYLEKTDSEGTFQETVQVMDEQIGVLSLKNDPSRPLTEEDKKLAAMVANQVAQQVENIRLLADASRARAEAEEATRRMTQESWQDYSGRHDSESLGFIYDTVKVSPVNDSKLPMKVTLNVPLEVRGEQIGNLAAATDGSNEPEALELAASIAAQTSIHLETLRLTEELQRRAEELLELDRLKSGFLANMSHELRTPLNSILGFADVLLLGLDGPLTDEMSNDLGLIQKNGQHLLHLINDVLDMAKIESGRMNLSPEKFKVHDVLKEVNDITSTLASEKNISLYIEKNSDKKVEIIADNTRLRQVMINLVNNAIKFTEGGTITIRVDKQHDANVLIRVKDTGSGIPPEKLDDIFMEFTQVDTSSTRKSGGTGLGLPISRRLIEMHGGRLWAESTGVPGEGSTFYVELPIEARITDAIEKREK